MNTRGFGAALIVAALCMAQTTPPSRRVTLPAGFRPAALVAADFNGDGVTDIAITGESERLLILLGDGRGGLRALPVGARAGKQPYAIIAADMNGDGRMDLVVANHDTDHLTLLTGDGKGAFIAREIKVPSKPHPHMVAAADIDHDGKMELITDSWMEDRLLIVRTDGRSIPIDVGRKPYLTLSAADLDGDGNVDLVTPNEGLGTVSILFGDGRGQFTHATQSPIPAGAEPFAATIADVNGDGRPDIVVGNYSGHITDTARDGVTWIRNDGSRHFTAFTNRVAVGHGTYRVAAGDFNGDGIADIAAANGAASDVTIVYGSHAGPQRSISIPTMAGPHAIAMADLNGDGRADLLVISENRDEMLVINGR